MNLLIINHYAGSEAMGMEYRHFYIGRELARLGHRVVIVAASFSHLRGQNPFPEESLEETTEQGVTFVWLKTPPYYRNNLFRAKNAATFLWTLHLHARELSSIYRPDAVVASSTYLFDLYPASRIARLSGARLIFELHDVWPLTLTELHGLSRKNPLVMALAHAERDSYRRAHRIISILPGAAQRAKELGLWGKPVIYIPNGVVPEAQEGCQPSAAQRRIRELKEQGFFTIVYAGGFANANALETLVDCAALLPDDIAVVLVGKGDQSHALADRAAKKGLHNLFFEEYVPKQKVPSVLREADCLYIGAKKCALYRYGVGMNKLYDYMLAARPILYGVDAPGNEVADCGCGITVAPDDPRALAEGVEAMRRLTAFEREEMGVRGRDYVLKNRAYSTLAAQFLSAMQ